jgi:hypothetical protein
VAAIAEAVVVVDVVEIVETAAIVGTAGNPFFSTKRFWDCSKPPP